MAGNGESSLPSTNMTAYEIASLLGSGASILGLIIVLWQLRALKKAARATQRAVEETRQRLITLLSVSDVAKAIHTLEQVQSYVDAKEYKLARIRLQDLQGLLAQFNEQEHFARVTQPQEYSRLSRSVKTDLISLSEVIEDSSRQLNYSQLHRTLEEVRDALNRCENHLKREVPEQ